MNKKRAAEPKSRRRPAKPQPQQIHTGATFPGDGTLTDKGNDVIRTAAKRRQAEREKRAGWIAAENVLNADNPNDLIRALKSGAVDCLFVHPTRWWLKPSTLPEQVWKGARFKNGQLWRNGVCLESHHQQLDLFLHLPWQWLATATADARTNPSIAERPINLDTPTKAPSKGALRQRRYRERKASRNVTAVTLLRKAQKSQIRDAVKAEYTNAESKGEKPPNVRELPPLVRSRLKETGYKATWAAVNEIAQEFDNRLPPGTTWKRKRRQSKFHSQSSKISCVVKSMQSGS